MADIVITLPPGLQLKAKNNSTVSEIEYEHYLRKSTSSTDQAVVVRNPAVSYNFEKQRHDPVSSTSAQGPLINKDSNNILIDRFVDIHDSDTCTGILDETNGILTQNILNSHVTQYTLTTDGRLIRQ